MPDLRQFASKAGLNLSGFPAGQQTQIVNALSAAFSSGYLNGYRQGTAESPENDD
jgi:hypothetical protein